MQPKHDDDWSVGAACANVLNDDIWFPEKGNRWALEKAEKICNTCPVFNLCAVESIEERHGIWAATTPEMRSLARSRMRRTA